MKKQGVQCALASIPTPIPNRSPSLLSPLPPSYGKTPSGGPSRASRLHNEKSREGTSQQRILKYESADDENDGFYDEDNVSSGGSDRDAYDEEKTMQVSSDQGDKFSVWFHKDHTQERKNEPDVLKFGSTLVLDASSDDELILASRNGAGAPVSYRIRGQRVDIERQADIEQDIENQRRLMQLAQQPVKPSPLFYAVPPHPVPRAPGRLLRGKLHSGRLHTSQGPLLVEGSRKTTRKIGTAQVATARRASSDALRPDRPRPVHEGSAARDAVAREPKVKKLLARLWKAFRLSPNTHALSKEQFVQLQLLLGKVCDPYFQPDLVTKVCAVQIALCCICLLL
jgi:hypothetical protein